MKGYEDKIRFQNSARDFYSIFGFHCLSHATMYEAQQFCLTSSFGDFGLCSWRASSEFRVIIIMLHNAGEYGTNKTYLTSLNFGPLLWYRGGQKLKGVQLWFCLLGWTKIKGPKIKEGRLFKGPKIKNYLPCVRWYCCLLEVDERPSHSTWHQD